MTRQELLTIVVGRARSNGFEFKRWYTTRLELPWISAEAALKLLDTQRRYYALLFSHEFAEAFWKAGTEITFEVPNSSFQRRKADGTIGLVQRKSFIRRSARRDVWRYHLREMALASEPLRYIRKYLNVEDELTEDIAAGTAEVVEPQAAKGLPATRSREKPLARPLPTGLPEFLRRPYRKSDLVPASALLPLPPRDPAEESTKRRRKARLPGSRAS
jgi:hypothetical protein